MAARSPRERALIVVNFGFTAVLLAIAGWTAWQAAPGATVDLAFSAGTDREPRPTGLPALLVAPLLTLIVGLAAAFQKEWRTDTTRAVRTQWGVTIALGVLALVFQLAASQGLLAAG